MNMEQPTTQWAEPGQQSTSQIRLIPVARSRFGIDAMARLMANLPTVQIHEGCRDFFRLPLAVEQYRPDVIMVRSALELEGLKDPAQFLELRTFVPELGLIFFVRSMDEAERILVATLSPGVGVITDDTRESELGRMIELVATGYAIIAPTVTKEVVLHRLLRPYLRPAYPELSERELVLLERLATGFSEAQIAAELGTSIRTVQHTLTTAREKLGAVGRTHAVALALHANLIKGPEKFAH